MSLNSVFRPFKLNMNSSSRSLAVIEMRNRNRLKIYEKHKEIEELNAYIHKMNSKKERGSEDSNTKGELPR